MMTPTTFEKDLGRLIRSRFGENTKVVRFGDDQEEQCTFIVSGVDCPERGVTSYGSVGLYKAPQRVGGSQILVEIVAACASATANIDNLLASCVFDAIKNRSQVIYGSFIENIALQYGISSTLNHVAFVSPFLWDDLDKLEVEGRSVYLLLMLPISDAELSFLKGNGIDALEKRFSENQIDIFDINRPSVV